LKNVIIILTILFTESISFAQEADQGRLYAGPETYYVEYNFNNSVNAVFIPVDNYAALADYRKYDSYRNLAIALTKPFDDEVGKVRSIYTWIALNIRYDREALLKGKGGNQIAEEVWKNRLAVCEGYANLFEKMCTEAGVESRMVKGYVKGFAGEDLSFPNHVWNSVKIDGKWQLLDVTWASVNNDTIRLSGKKLVSEFTRKKLDFFFLVKPKQMILTHLPEDPYWQLQSNIINMDLFLSGQEAIRANIREDAIAKTNFEQLIDEYEQLDSLDKCISLMERMEKNNGNKIKEYGLGIAYYYKAQKIIKEADNHNTTELRDSRNLALLYYQKSIDQLTLLQEDDYGYEFSRDLLKNVLFKMEVL
jgi:hypothetical protein